MRWIGAIILAAAVGAGRLSLDLVGDGRPDAVVLTQGERSVDVLVRFADRSRAPESFSFRLDPQREDGVCRLPVHLQAESLDYDLAAAVGEAVPGFVRSKKASGFAIIDGACDPIHFFFNHKTGRMQWWREPVIRFHGGEAIVSAISGGGEHVAIEDARGNVTSDSYCNAGAGDYGQIVRLGAAIRTAAAHGDRAVMAGLMGYPLRINGPAADNGSSKTIQIKSRAELLSRYGLFFGPRVIQRLAQMEPHDVFCRNGMSMLGGGILWARLDRAGELKAVVVNEPP